MSSPTEEKPAEEAKKELPTEEGEEEEAEEEKVQRMGIDEFYPEGYVDKELPDSAISKTNSKFCSIFGVDSFKRYNLHFLTEQTVIFANGNTYQILNLQTSEKQTFFGNDTDGIGSIAVHPKRTHFAVAEKGAWPNVYIYEYPSLKLYRILKRGTEKAYSHVEFSNSGEKLCTVGSNPDYTLTVWDWLA